MCTIPLNCTTARWLLGPYGERNALCVTDNIPPLVLVYAPVGGALSRRLMFNGKFPRQNHESLATLRTSFSNYLLIFIIVDFFFFITSMILIRIPPFPH